MWGSVKHAVDCNIFNFILSFRRHGLFSYSSQLFQTCWFFKVSLTVKVPCTTLLRLLVFRSFSNPPRRASSDKMREKIQKWNFDGESFHANLKFSCSIFLTVQTYLCLKKSSIFSDSLQTTSSTVWLIWNLQITNKKNLSCAIFVIIRSSNT